MDMVLVDHFATEFDDAHKPSVSALASPRAVSKLRKQVRKTKEILSANKEAPISVEGMHEDHDFRSSIKRAEFEKLAETAGIRACATAPLQTILERLPEHGVALKDLEAVEVFREGADFHGPLVCTGNGVPVEHVTCGENLSAGFDLAQKNRRGFGEIARRSCRRRASAAGQGGGENRPHQGADPYCASRLAPESAHSEVCCFPRQGRWVRQDQGGGRLHVRRRQRRHIFVREAFAGRDRLFV